MNKLKKTLYYIIILGMYLTIILIPLAIICQLMLEIITELEEQKQTTQKNQQKQITKK